LTIYRFDQEINIGSSHDKVIYNWF